MKKLILLAALWSLAAWPVSAQVAISNLPAATLPLTGSEVVSGVQNGSTVKIPTTAISPCTSFGAVAGTCVQGNAGVTGPGSSVVGDLAVWNNVGGTVLKDVNPSTIIGNSTVTLVSATGSTALGAFSQIVAVSTASASAVSIVLPASSNFPNCPVSPSTCPVITVKDAIGDSSAGLITVSAADGKVMDGVSSYALPFTGQAADFFLMGTSWGVK